MREKPILFSGPMVKAILEGKKTMTRRVIKHIGNEPHYINKLLCDWYLSGDPELIEDDKWKWVLQNDVDSSATYFFKCPYGKPGDRLWVRETWHGAVDGDEPNYGIIYKASWPHGPGDAFKRDDRAGRYFIGSADGKWRPSIFMPRWASRIDLEITDIRVERVNEITPDDCTREGVDVLPFKFDEYAHSPIYTSARGSEIFKFYKLWDSINAKKHPWASNPWVWVISFKRIKP